MAPVGSILPATMAARVNGRWVVTQQWVADSYGSGQWLDESRYSLSEVNTLSSTVMEHAKPPIQENQAHLKENVFTSRKLLHKPIHYLHSRPEHL